MTQRRFTVKCEAGLKQECIEEGQKQERKKGIFVYLHVYELGYLLYYQNKSRSLTYIDEVEFKLRDLKVEGGHCDDRIIVAVNPGEDKLVKVIITGDDPEMEGLRHCEEV